MGPATRIFFAPSPNSSRVFLNIVRTEHVRLESVFVVAMNAEALVRITESHFCRVEDCGLINVPGRPSDQIPAARAIDLTGNCSYCEINDNSILAAKGVTSTNGQALELQVRDNQFLALQVSVLLNQATGIEVVHNQMRGLPRTAIPGDINLSRSTIDQFQALVSEAFRATPSFSNFQAAGVIIFTGNRVVISQNLITAQVAVLGFLFINARVHQNDIVSLIGSLQIFGIRVKIEDNFVLGLFAGLIQAGVIVDFDCTSNEWLGLHGIIWMSLAELARSFGLLLGAAIGSAGLAANGPAVVNAAAAAGTAIAGDLRAFGMAVIAKVHRNVFFTFINGIRKTDAVISADISIIDNTFSFCSRAGIELGGGGRNGSLLVSLLPVINLRHLIQSNALAVQGRGIVSSNFFTQVEQNSVQCPSIAIELDAAICSARNNSLTGLATTDTPPDAGLIIVHGAARGAIVSGNRLFNAPGHAILIRDDVLELAIEDNHIQGARRCGIGTYTDATALIRASISRNHVRFCQGDVGDLRFGGAVVIGEGRDLRLIDNVVNVNSPLTPFNQFLLWFAVYVEDGDGIELSGNAVTENATLTGLGGILGAVGVVGVRGALRIQNNLIRNNGGIALIIGENAASNQVQQALIQNNHFTGNPNPSSPTPLVVVGGIESLLFQGNQCLQTSTPSLVFLTGSRVNVTGNVVDLISQFEARVMLIAGADLVVSANSVRSGPRALQVTGLPMGPGPVNVIITSNLTSGISASSTGALIRANNIPAP